MITHNQIRQLQGFYWILNDRDNYEIVYIDSYGNVWSTGCEEEVEYHEIKKILPMRIDFRNAGDFQYAEPDKMIEQSSFFKSSPTPIKTPIPENIKKRRRLLR